MTEKDIKPIPKYIMDEIYKRDLKIYPWQEATVRFYAYLSIWKKELVKVTVAVTKQKKQWSFLLIFDKISFKIWLEVAPICRIDRIRYH